jgi:molybdate transport system substrate-binding protein
MKNIVAPLLLALVLATPATAGEIKVLSAGAVEPGLVAFAQLVKRETGHDLKIQFNTAPRIAERLAAGEAYDILISPPAVIAQAAKDGKVDAATRVAVGRVGAGIIVRSGAPAPDVTSVDALKATLLAADSIVYNTASTGLYLDRLFDKLGILERIKPKTTRYPDGAAVMEHVIRSKGSEIGFGAMTEIRMYEPKGLKLVGPLPPDVQNYTSYDAVVMTGAAAPAAAKAALALLASPAGKAAFAGGGVE